MDDEQSLVLVVVGDDGPAPLVSWSSASCIVDQRRPWANFFFVASAHRPTLID